MHQLVIQNLSNKQIESHKDGITILKLVQEYNIDWMHACGGKGRCTTCKAIILKGSENIGPLTEAEQKYRDLGRLAQNERLACQAQIFGDITLEIPNENKFPHMQYSK
jgi:ferredoxin, 2Fe-2S